MGYCLCVLLVQAAAGAMVWQSGLPRSTKSQSLTHRAQKPNRPGIQAPRNQYKLGGGLRISTACGSYRLNFSLTNPPGVRVSLWASGLHLIFIQLFPWASVLRLSIHYLNILLIFTTLCNASIIFPFYRWKKTEPRGKLCDRSTCEAIPVWQV